MKKGFFYTSIIVIVYILTFSINLPDYDLWARLAVGSIFFQTGNILKHDIFSYLPTKSIWIDHEWGTGVVFYFFVNYFDEWGLFILKALILFAIFLFMIKTIKLQTGKDTAGIFYFIFLGFSLLPGIANLLRSQMFTYLFFSLWIYILEKIRREDYHGYESQNISWVKFRNKLRCFIPSAIRDCSTYKFLCTSFWKFESHNKLIWMLPVTMLLWANMHGGFIAGIGLVGIYAAGEWLNRNKSLKYIAILALIIPVTLLNPYGWKLWNYIIDASFMPRPYITEWEPIGWNGPFHVVSGFKIHVHSGFIIFSLLTLIAGIKLYVQKAKPDWTKIIIFITLFYLGIRHQRHTAFFVLAVPVLFYKHYVDLFKPIQTFVSNQWTETHRHKWMTLKYCFGYVMLATILLYISPYLSQRILLNPLYYPIGSFQFIKQNKISGNLATSFHWGSYALWKLYPQCKVMIDGRYEEVYNNLYDIGMQLSENKGNVQEILKQYKADVLVLAKDKYSPLDILNFSDWKLVYQDLSSVVLLPKNTIKSAYIYPDDADPVYHRENLSKNVNLSHKNFF